MSYQKQLNQSIRRVDDLITLHTSKLDTSAETKSKVAAIGPIDPKQVTADTIAALEAIKNLLTQIETEWMDSNGNWRKVKWYNMLFNAADRRLVGRTIDAVVTTTNLIVQIYTDGKPG